MSFTILAISSCSVIFTVFPEGFSVISISVMSFAEYSGRFYTACPVMETVDSGMMETAIPEMQNQ